MGGRANKTSPTKISNPRRNGSRTIKKLRLRPRKPNPIYKTRNHNRHRQKRKKKETRKRRRRNRHRRKLRIRRTTNRNGERKANAPNLQIQRAAPRPHRQKPNHRSSRRNRLRENHPAAPIPPRSRLHKNRRRRLHPAPKSRRDVRGRESQRRNGGEARPRGGLRHQVRGLHLRQDRHQVHDRRHASARVHDGARFKVLLDHDHRRGPREDPPHRRLFRFDQGPHQGPGKPQSDHLFSYAGRAKILGILRQRADYLGPGEAIPRRHLLHPTTRSRLRRSRDRHRAANPHDPAAGRHPDVPHRPGGDRGRDGSAAAQDQGPRHPGRRAAHPAHLRQSALGPADEDFRAHATGREEDCHRDKHRGDVDHDRQHRLRDRHRLFQAEHLQPADRRGEPDRDADLEGLGQPEGRQSRQGQAGEVLQDLHEMVLHSRARRQHDPGDTKSQSRRGRADAEEHGDQQFGQFRLHGRAAA